MKTKSILRELDNNFFLLSKNGNNYTAFSDDRSREFSFYDQNGEAVALRTRKANDVSDIREDYFGGQFQKRLKDCIQFLKG